MTTARMTDATRTEVAHLLRSYRRITQDYARKAAVQTGWQAEQARAMAARYRVLLAGALDMLDTIRGL